MVVPHFFLRLKKLSSIKQLMFFWYRNYKKMFFLGFLCVLTLGGYFWYQHLYQYQWSPERKKEYLERNFTETNFKEKAFHDTVAHLKIRAESLEEVPVLTRDLFSGQPLQ